MYAPIPYHKQAGHFGVYVSPKMNTHVFIGPFSMSAGCDGDEMLATKMGTALEECARNGIDQSSIVQEVNGGTCAHTKAGARGHDRRGSGCCRSPSQARHDRPREHSMPRQ